MEELFWPQQTPWSPGTLLKEQTFAFSHALSPTSDSHIYVLPKHLGKLLISRPYQHDAISVLEHCIAEVKVPVRQSVAQSWTAKIIYIIQQDSSGVLLPCQLKTNCFWCSLLIKIKGKNEFTRSDGSYQMPRVGWICFSKKTISGTAPAIGVNTF